MDAIISDIIRCLLMRYLFTLLVCLLTLAPLMSAQSLVDRGKNAERQGLYDLAEKYYRQSVDSSHEARVLLGILLERKEHFSEASHWLASGDSGALALTHLAICQAELYRWAEARHTAQCAIEATDTGAHTLRADAMATLALTYCHDENYTNALLWAHRALNENPHSARAHNVVGIIEFRKGNENEAIRSFKEALKVDSRNIDAHFNLGAVYCYRNRYELAISTLKSGLKVERNSVKLIYCLGWAYLLKGENEHAVECLESVVRYDSNYVDAYNRLGDIRYEQGDFNQAIAHYRKATQVAPYHSEGYRLLGRAYLAKGQTNKALRNYQKAIEINNKDSEAYYQLALLYSQQKQSKKELANYKRAAKLGHREAQKWCVKKGVEY